MIFPFQSGKGLFPKMAQISIFTGIYRDWKIFNRTTMVFL